MFIRPLHLLRAALLLATALLISCGGGGTIPTTGVQLRGLPSDFGTRKAVAYSPFRTLNRNTEVVTTAEVAQDLNLLVQGGFTLLRLYDSSNNASRPNGGSTEMLLQTIQANNLNVKVQPGVYIQNGDPTGNQAEVARGIALANTYPSIVATVSVGNENLVSWSSNAVTVASMVGYINAVRSSVTQPITCDDNWLFFSGTDVNNPTPVLNVIDYVSMHTYPIIDSITAPGSWDWQQVSVPANQRAAAMMNASLAYATANFSAVRSNLDSSGFKDMPITIGETGWKAVATGGETQRASPVNQSMYLTLLGQWTGPSTTGAKPTAIFYFEAFDEPWKGSDDGWGLFDVSRKARWAIQSLYPSSDWEPGTYTLADAVYYIPTAGNPTITANRYTVYADVAVAGEAAPTQTPVWVGFNSPATAFSGQATSTFAPQDGPNSLQVTPAPQNATPMFGWGLIASLPSSSDDLSNFAATGHLNFSIKSTYPGKIQVGFLTGTTTASTNVQAYIVIDPATAQYGYQNDGNWHNVSIPLSAIIPNATPAYGQPASATLNLAQVTAPFVIADLYASTGKTTSVQGVGNTTTFFIDDIYWSK